jgi:chromosome condensin MukBEF ATPase and DNA-binding subunit MukB
MYPFNLLLRLISFTVDEHQQFQRKIETLKNELESKDKIIQDVAFQLRKVEKTLQDLVDEGKSKLEIIKEAEQCTYFDILPFHFINFSNISLLHSSNSI